MQKNLTNSKWLRKIKQSLKLSDLQESVLIGTILGDGYLRLSKSGKAARLQICHSKSAREYLYYLHDVFEDFVFAKPDFQITNQALRFTTISHIDLLPIYSMFYTSGVKTIPSNIGEFLTHPISLAIWFMDDGNGYKNKSSYRISTYAFGLEGSQILIDCLHKNFGIQTNLIRDSKGYQIYIPVKDGNSSRFYDLVSPFIIPSMRYKL
ncbi:MAG: hypothetical protein HN936_18550 [Bacteroidetes bacterium]|jgi:hypothetical protein|nr:hypothetical protein [Bacteroidota bacterium]